MKIKYFVMGQQQLEHFFENDYKNNYSNENIMIINFGYSRLSNILYNSENRNYERIIEIHLPIEDTLEICGRLGRTYCINSLVIDKFELAEKLIIDNIDKPSHVKSSIVIIRCDAGISRSQSFANSFEHKYKNIKFSSWHMFIGSYDIIKLADTALNNIRSFEEYKKLNEDINNDREKRLSDVKKLNIFI